MTHYYMLLLMTSKVRVSLLEKHCCGKSMVGVCVCVLRAKSRTSSRVSLTQFFLLGRFTKVSHMGKRRKKISCHSM